MPANPPAQPERRSLYTVITDLHAKIKLRADLVVKLTQHPDTTDAQMLEALQSGRKFHGATRPMFNTLKQDLHLIGIDLVEYDKLPFTASPFVPRGRMMSLGSTVHLPIAEIRRKIQAAKSRLGQ